MTHPGMALVAKQYIRILGMGMGYRFFFDVTD